jgi:dTDP-4-dehydrorhamnose 3,5-epimerase
MEIEHLEIPEVLLLKPGKYGDRRGFFSEVYSKRALSEVGVMLDFVQDNHSRSSEKGTLRGLHFQSPPFAQDKLIRVLKGAILDVAVDIRVGSATYGQHVACEISETAWNQILIPKGFAHGFCTLEPDTEVAYKVTNYYAPDHDFGLNWQDPALGIDWPVSEAEAILSEKDREHPNLRDLSTFFNNDTDR